MASWLASHGLWKSEDAVTVNVDLPSGLRVSDAERRLLRYCDEEYGYYDGIPSTDANQITPLDVLVTTAVNAFSIASARRIREIHRGFQPLAAQLADIPPDADLARSDAAETETVRRLLHAAVVVPGVLVAVATKVLHRKRPSLIPMMDSVIVGHYRNSSGEKWLAAAWEDQRRAADAGIRVMELFRTDLQATKEQLDTLVTKLTDAGYPMTPVRALELLIWTETEPQGNYRDVPPVSQAAVNSQESTAPSEP